MDLKLQSNFSILRKTDASTKPAVNHHCTINPTATREREREIEMGGGPAGRGGAAIMWRAGAGAGSNSPLHKTNPFSAFTKNTSSISSSNKTQKLSSFSSSSPTSASSAAFASSGSVLLPSWTPFSSSLSASHDHDHDDDDVDCGFETESESDWVSISVVNNKNDGFHQQLWSVPSMEEVQTTVSAIQLVFDSTSNTQNLQDKYALQIDGKVDRKEKPSPLVDVIPSCGSDFIHAQPPMHPSNGNGLHPYCPDRVYDAFHMLQTEPAVQKMVISLSSDKAVWNAVLNNEVVRELRESYHAAETGSLPAENSSDNSEKPNKVLNAVKWLFDNTKAKFIEVLEKITKMVGSFFRFHGSGETAAVTEDPFEEKLKTSFLLSIVVLMVVVVSRAHKA